MPASATIARMATAASLLVLIETAIENLLTGEHESYTIGSRTVTRLDLADLFEERRLLKAEAAKDATTSGNVRLAKMWKTSR